MKKNRAIEKINWMDGVTTEMEVIVPPETVREIEIAAVNRYRRALDGFIRRSAANPEEKRRMSVALFSVLS